MQCFTELIPPTAVTHALSLHFTSPTANNLVVAKTSLLQVFSLKTVSTELDTGLNGGKPPGEISQAAERRSLNTGGLEQSFLGADVVLQRSERAQTTKLVLVAEYTLSGCITSIAPLKILGSKTGAEVLLVAFQDAKLSLVEWDPDCYGLATISIHYYEREDLQRSPFAPDLNQIANILTVDPSSRCAAFSFGARNLAILPFRQAGDDLVMDDYGVPVDYDADMAEPQPDMNAKSSAKTNGESTSHSTPYMASFVLPISALDSNLVHPIHLSFLYEYREPTFGILFSTLATSTSLLRERRDVLCYTVFTLDLEQRASTAILSVTGLPYDLHKVIPLPSPVGGALLVGGNELVHVDQAGKTNGVALNIFAKESSAFSMVDQSELGMRLEGCTIELLGADTGEMLLILDTGELAIVTFRLDGRSVSGLSVRRVGSDKGGTVLKAGSSCVANIGRGRAFIGSEDTDSIVLGWTRRSHQRQRTGPENGTESEEYFDQDDTEDYDDDLYSGADPDGLRQSDSFSLGGPDFGGGKDEDYVFRVNDSLINLAPMKDLTFGKAMVIQGDEEKRDDRRVTADLELVTSRGHHKSGGLSVLKQELEPTVIGMFDFPEASNIWSVRAKRPVMKELLPHFSGRDALDVEGGYSLENEFDRFMIVSKTSAERGEESAVYALNPTGFEELQDTEFDPAAGGTVDVGTIGCGIRIVQVLKGEVRSYDGNLGLAQIYPMADDVTGAEPKVVSASFADPYVLIMRDDNTIMILECDDSGDFEEVESSQALKSRKWLSGSLYADSEEVFAQKGSQTNVHGAKKSILMFLLTVDGGLEIYTLPNFDSPTYTALSLGFLPPLLSAGYTARRPGTRAELTEILVAELGDSTAKSPYLIVRVANDDLTIYQPFHRSATEQDQSLSLTLQFLKISNPSLAKAYSSSVDLPAAETDTSSSPLRRLPDVGGYSTVFLPGVSPSFILKEASTTPKVINLRGKAVKGMSGFHTGGCEKGWVYVDVEGVVRVSQLPQGVRYADTGWSTRTVDIGEEIEALAYHPPTETYVIATSEKVDFELPKDDDYHKEWAKEDISFKPQIDQGSIKLLSPVNWSIIETYPLQPHEIALSVKTLSLETSELTHSRAPLIAVGTSHTLITDLPCRGSIYIFEIINVVPEPGRPETDRKLKLISKEDVKGAVTALSEVGTQGFLLAAQGQKCMVRGLKEDGTLLPVAFIDMMCHVSVTKTLPGTGMCVLGDAVRGVWFVGYAEEPYKMTVFGKSNSHLEVLAADFLPHENQLFIVVADGTCNLHVLQFDPEHPKSLSGTRLLHRTVFHTGHFPSTLTRIPTLSPQGTRSVPVASDAPPLPPQQTLLLTSRTGSLSILTPLSEPVYRRLSSLHSALTNLLDHPCGLNPRAYRAPTGAAAVNAMTGLGSDVLGGARGVLDEGLLRRWWELGTGKRGEVAARAGVRAEEVRSDLEVVAGRLGVL
ncbi:MAG: mRNA cleavage and polyadenylation factor subunit [Sclerophora amabilis]|nr:MAG: mRNA cleavage and polyadenylation factor subunit [Sclerophora amabilis]